MILIRTKTNLWNDCKLIKEAQLTKRSEVMLKLRNLNLQTNLVLKVYQSSSKSKRNIQKSKVKSAKPKVPSFFDGKP